MYKMPTEMHIGRDAHCTRCGVYEMHTGRDCSATGSHRLPEDTIYSDTIHSDTIHFEIVKRAREKQPVLEFNVSASP